MDDKLINYKSPKSEKLKNLINYYLNTASWAQIRFITLGNQIKTIIQDQNPKLNIMNATNNEH